MLRSTWFGLAWRALAAAIGLLMIMNAAMAQNFERRDVTFKSAGSNIVGWPIAECECLTLHGRPLARFAGFLYPGARLLLLSHDGTTPAQIAAELVRRGFGSSRLILLELGTGVRSHQGHCH